MGQAFSAEAVVVSPITSRSGGDKVRVPKHAWSWHPCAMERFEVHTNTANAEELAYVEAECFDETPAGGVRKAELRADLYRDRTLYVGFIETNEEWRGTGVASRLLLHVIDLLKPTTVAAQTVNTTADALFASVKRATGAGVRFDID
ncbi:GNAT family N-acetyltransferase [Microbacterium sp. LMI12-1-1.1]|uniref:GNAT family N-acetyltransferase n=1 Tax=Microbacterium sp. LMI12-1-1.1 TaxID=3135225 RepID=UPI00341EA34E